MMSKQTSAYASGIDFNAIKRRNYVFNRHRYEKKMTWIFNYYIHQICEASVRANQCAIWLNKKLQFHRDNGPAILERGYMGYYQNDMKHRVDGPAEMECYEHNYVPYFSERACYSRRWYRYGMLHNEYGPARICKYYNGDVAIDYYIDGKRIGMLDFTKRCFSKAIKNVLQTLTDWVLKN